MKSEKTSYPTIRIDGRKLRDLRNMKGMTQQALAERANYSRIYIDKLERGERKGLLVGTIERLARALGVEELDLVDPHSQEPLLARQQMLGRTLTADSATTVAAGLWKSESLERGIEPSPQQKTVRTILVPQCLEKAEGYMRKGQWDEAEQVGLRGRAQYPSGSPAWVELTLRICALAAQQAGRIVDSRTYIAEVNHKHVSLTDPSDPCLLGWIHLQTGWIEVEQAGQLRVAALRLADGLMAARELGPVVGADLRSRCLHFQTRIALEHVMGHAGCWLSMYPPGDLHPNLRQSLQRVLEKHVAAEEELYEQMGEVNPNTVYRKLVITSLIQHSEVRSADLREAATRHNDNSAYLWRLGQARCSLSAREWDSAVGEAEEAYGYAAGIHFPQGMAYAAAVRAYALLRSRGTNEERKSVDLWVHALLLHPYRSHPLFKTALGELRELLIEIEQRQRGWFQNYLAELDDRVYGNDPIFALPETVPSAATHELPSWFIRDHVDARISPTSLRLKYS